MPSYHIPIIPPLDLKPSQFVLTAAVLVKERMSDLGQNRFGYDRRENY